MRSVYFWLVLCSFCNLMADDSIRILSFPSTAGFVKDVVILEDTLTQLGKHVEKKFIPEMVDSVIDGNSYQVVDVQIFIQEYDDKLLPFGKKNYLIPNPEWCWNSIEELKKVDLILARTREVERIYSEVGLPVYYLGFTGVDQYIEVVEKKFTEYFHLKGFSPFKSAHEIVEAWTSHFPHLIIVDHWPNYKKVVSKISILAKYLTDYEIKWLQNRAGVHLCPSQTEGFGHYLGEALSVGSVVITTDAPPMNEFVTDPRFLVKPQSTSKHGWATLYQVSPKDIRKIIYAVHKIPLEELKEVGRNNRNRFLEMKSEFIERLKVLVE